MKRTSAEAGEETRVETPAMADLHTHLIPGVDDGARDLDSALDTLRALREDGVVAVAATPHLNASSPNGTRRARADRAWPELARRAASEVPELGLYRGYEIQLDTPELDLADPSLRLAGSRFALVEFFAFTIPERSTYALARIAEDGYVPIIAHPERYWGYDRAMSVVADWRGVGALLQLNGGSLLGEYGDRVRAAAQHLLGQGQVDLIASDNHGRPRRRPSLRQVWDHMVARGLAEQAELLLATNPQRILRDESPLPVGRVEVPGLLSRLKRTLFGQD